MPGKPAKGQKKHGSRQTRQGAKGKNRTSVSESDDIIKRKRTKKGSTLPQRIRDAAARIGGLAELARRLGVPRQSLTRWTAATKPTIPGADRLAEIAHHTGCDPAWLLTGQGRPEPALVAGSSVADEVGLHLEHVISDLVELLGKLRPALTSQQVDDLRKAIQREW